MTTLLLTGAGGSAAANFLDSLRRAGTGDRVVGADASAVRLHLSSCDANVVLPRADDDRYLAHVRSVVESYGVEMVHAQPDAEVLLIGRLRGEIPAVTFLPDQQALETAADKGAFAEAMDAAAVPVPASTAYDDLDRVAARTEQLLADHERVWVRARRGAGSRASLPVSSGEQASAWVGWWISERGLEASDFMASEMLPGREFAYQSLWADGRLVVGQARERVEYLYGHLTPSGQTSTPAVARTVAEPHVDQLACDAIRALDPVPNGIYCVDIKEAATGDPKVTEVNAGRFFTTSNFFAAAGVNMPEMYVRLAMGGEVPEVGTGPLPAGLYWVRMVDMGYKLVAEDELDPWSRPDS